MTLRGRVHNGVVIPDDPVSLPEGAAVQIELLPAVEPQARRTGCVWKGQVTIAEDFDELPDDLAEAFGVTPP